MSRNRKPPRDFDREAERVGVVMAMGYYVQEFSDTHFRIADRVDFWPSTGKWSDRDAARDSVKRAAKESGGFLALIAHLVQHVPTARE